ncbi:MAG TPA: hypothetical protein VEA41_13215 [Salinarimonas sp.]|nr:hypothetical protein [Salinarimonas sp.]
MTMSHPDDSRPALPPAAERPGASVIAGADLIRRVDRLVSEIEALKAERAGKAVRIARARLGVAYHEKRAAPAEEPARAA